MNTHVHVGSQLKVLAVHHCQKGPLNAMISQASQPPCSPQAHKVTQRGPNRRCVHAELFSHITCFSIVHSHKGIVVFSRGYMTANRMCSPMLLNFLSFTV